MTVITAVECTQMKIKRYLHTHYQYLQPDGVTVEDIMIWDLYSVRVFALSATLAIRGLRLHCATQMDDLAKLICEHFSTTTCLTALRLVLGIARIGKTIQCEAD